MTNRAVARSCAGKRSLSWISSRRAERALDGWMKSTARCDPCPFLVPSASLPPSFPTHPSQRTCLQPRTPMLPTSSAAEAAQYPRGQKHGRRRAAASRQGMECWQQGLRSAWCSGCVETCLPIWADRPPGDRGLTTAAPGSVGRRRNHRCCHAANDRIDDRRTISGCASSK